MIKNTILFTLIVLFATACVTPYGPRGMTGGYMDEKIDDDTYLVSFNGNGNTSSDRVWFYWIYRCAELTKEQGYDYFTITPIDKTSQYYDELKNSLAYEFTMIDPQSLAQNESNSDMDDAGNYRKVYYYTVTTYSSRAQIDMYKHPGPMDIKFLLNAETILKELDQYVKKGKEEAVDRKALLVRAAIEAAIRRNLATKEDLEKLKL